MLLPLQPKALQRIDQIRRSRQQQHGSMAWKFGWVSLYHRPQAILKGPNHGWQSFWPQSICHALPPVSQPLSVPLHQSSRPLGSLVSATRLKNSLRHVPTLLSSHSGNCGCNDFSVRLSPRQITAHEFSSLCQRRVLKGRYRSAEQASKGISNHHRQQRIPYDEPVTSCICAKLAAARARDLRATSPYADDPASPSLPKKPGHAYPRYPRRGMANSRSEESSAVERRGPRLILPAQMNNGITWSAAFRSTRHFPNLLR